MADETTGTNDPGTGSNVPAPQAENFDIEMNPTLPVAPAALAVPSSAAKAPVPITSAALSAGMGEPPANETEFERTERLKLNTEDAPHSGEIKDDIAGILQSVKLPERRDFNAGADTKKPPVTVVPDIDAALKTAQSEKPADPEERPIVTASRTLKDDLQDIVRRKKISLVKAAALEQDKRKDSPLPTAQDSASGRRRRRTAVILFVSFLLIALGGAALYGVLLVQQTHANLAPPQYQSLIFAEQTETISIDNVAPDTLKATIAHALSGSLGPVGSITQIVPITATTSADGSTVTGPATLSQFFAALGISPPAQLMQGLGDSFFFGAHTIDTNVPLFVIPVTNYDLAFAGMLAWEPQMGADLSPIFTSAPALVTGSDGLPTARTFQDAVMRNYDVRELQDDNGNIILYYSFPTPNILIIAESPSTFAEVLSRLQAHGEL